MSALPILFVDHTGPMGGAETSMLLLLQALDREELVRHPAPARGALAAAAQRFDIARPAEEFAGVFHRAAGLSRRAARR